MDVTELARQLRADEPAAAYLICGEEGALVDRALGLISERVLAAAAQPDLALTRLDGRDSTAAEVEAAARTGSLFGGRRLIVLRDAQSLGAEEQKRLAVYLAEPVPTTSLVLVVRGAGPKTRDPRRSKAAKAARAYKKAIEKGGGTVVDCPRPKPRELPRLAEKLLEQGGLQVDRDGLYALVEAIGEDLGALDQAIEKLALYKGGRGRVAAADVVEVVADTRTQSVFDLTDAAAEGRLRQALVGLRRMLRDGESPLALLGHLARHFRNLARVQSLAQRGEGSDSIRQALGLHPFVVKKSLKQARRFSPPGLARRLQQLGLADRRLKSSGLADALVLELLVRQLCERGDARNQRR